MRARELAAAVFCVLIRSHAQQGSPRRYFSLTSQETVMPGGEAAVLVRSEGVRQLEFRLYRVRNPRAFFLKLGDPHMFPTSGRRIYPPRPPIEKLADWKMRLRTRLRNLARMQFSAENRGKIHTWLQRARRQPPTPAGAAPSFAAVPLLNPDQLVRRWTQTGQTKQQWDAATVRAPLEQAGVYVLEATDQQKTAYTVLISTPVTVVVKAWPETAALRVVDRSSGRPRSGCRVELLDLARKESLGHALTDNDGAASFEIRQRPGRTPLALADCGRATVPAKIPEHVFSPRRRSWEGAIHTDRPVCRPGQNVHFRAIVREKSEGRPVKPGARKACVKVDDGRGNSIFQRMLSFSKDETVSGTFDLNPDVPLGYFSITVTPDGTGEAIYGGFHVEDYRKPEYEVRVRPALSRTIQGSKVEAQIEARYSYGEPVAGAEVEWVVHRYRWFPPWWEWVEEETEEAEEYFGGEQILEARGRLDQEGRLVIAVPAERGEFDYQYRVEARMRDQGGRSISGAGGFLATRAPFWIRSQSGKWGWQSGEAGRFRTAPARVEPMYEPGAKAWSEEAVWEALP